jgi:DNA repair protein RecN (Recombination protein N)
VLRRLRIENLVLIRDAELELSPGLNAITGETGAGKTILAQAVGLLLGARGDAGFVGPAASEAYVEAELVAPAEVLDEDDAAAVQELRPESEDDLLLARRVFADGRTRAYAWGRSVAREDVAAVAERLVAMSGQFEQRRLARPSYQLDVLDRFAGDQQQQRRRELRDAWRALLSARRRLDQVTRDAAAEAARVEELRALVTDARGLAADAEDDLRAERERLRHVGDLLAAASAAGDALAPPDGDGAADLAARAGAAAAPLAHLAPELAEAADELAQAEQSLREVALSLRGFLASLEADPARLEHIEAELDRYATVRRRFRCESTAELLERAAAARIELEALDEAGDPEDAARRALAEAERRAATVAGAMHDARVAAAPGLADAVAEELRVLGMGDGEFRVEVRPRELSASGHDEVVFLIRPNPGLPFAPVADTASGGELSRVALAIAAAGAGSETLIFDEIDAGIGGRTATAVGRALQRLAARTQVVTITHLPQIASLADRHFSVEKVAGDPTHTTIRQLDDDERRGEVERMLGGPEFAGVLAGADAAGR